MPNTVLTPLSIRELFQGRPVDPAQPCFHHLAHCCLPLVYGLAVALIPEDPAAASRVTATVFESFAYTARGLRKSTVIPRWLVRSCWFAVQRERKRLKLQPKPESAGASALHDVLNAHHRTSTAMQDATVLRWMLDLPADRIAEAMRLRPARVEKLSGQGLRRAFKALSKSSKRWSKSRSARSTPGIAHAKDASAPPLGSNPVPFTQLLDAQSFLASILIRSSANQKPGDASTGEAGAAMAFPPRISLGVSILPPEVEAAVLDRFGNWPASPRPSQLVKEILRDWRWFFIGRILKRIAIGFSTSFAILATLAMVTAYLAMNGYLSLPIFRHMQKGLLKEFPELAIPARPWPGPSVAAKTQPAPDSPSQLYGMTNIWLVSLRMTPEQWKAVQPARVPVGRNNGGPVGMRNPNASRSGLAGMLGIDFRWSGGALDFADKHFDNVGVRYRGNGTFVNSLYGPKQSFKIDIDHHVKGQSLAGISTLNFVNSIPDFSYLKDALAEKLFRDLGVVAPRTAYSYLTLDVPGTFDHQPLGLYVLVENIDSDFAKDRFGTKQTPIFKPVTGKLFEDIGANWQAYAAIYDLKTKATPVQLERVVQFAHLISHASDDELARRLGEFLDLEEFAAFLAGHVLTSSYDGFLSTAQNFYVYLHPELNKFGFISWDQDHGWGEFGYTGTAEARENASIWHPQASPNHFLERVLKVAAFRDVYRRTLERGLREHFNPEKLLPQIDALAEVVRPAIAAESEFRLKRFELAVSTNWVSGPRDGKMNEGTAEGPKAPIHQLKRFIIARTQSVRDQLDGASEGMRVGGFGAR